MISVIIPVHNKWAFTKSCLEDLSKLDALKHEIILVDNASSDDTAKIQYDTYSNLKVLRQEVNLGFAGACNAGFKASSGDIVLFLNNDIRVKSSHADWTAGFFDALESEADLLVGPTVGHLDKSFNFLKEDTSFKDKYDYMSGWCLASRKSSFAKLVREGDEGPFSSEFGKAYFEDVDLSYRAKKMKFDFKLLSIPLVHFGMVTSKSLGLSSLYSTAKKVFVEKWK